MKQFRKIGYSLIAVFILSVVPTVKSQAQVTEIIKAIIKAIDLKVQHLQNHVIDLQNVQKEIENELSKLKLNEISDWVQKHKELYAQYFDELYKVKSIIAYYSRITDIIQKQKQLVLEYKQAYALTQQDAHFSPEEITYISGVYSGIIEGSMKSIDQIIVLLQSFSVQMTDAERLKLLNAAADEIEKQITDLRNFSSQNMQLSLQRSRDLNDLQAIRNLYGIKN